MIWFKSINGTFFIIFRQFFFEIIVIFPVFLLKMYIILFVIQFVYIK